MTTHVRLVSTIDVATVPRHLNAALNWAFNEGNWRNALSDDVPAGENKERVLQAMWKLSSVGAPPFSKAIVGEASKHLIEVLGLIRSYPDGRLVVE